MKKQIFNSSHNANVNNLCSIKIIVVVHPDILKLIECSRKNSDGNNISHLDKI